MHILLRIPNKLGTSSILDETKFSSIQALSRWEGRVLSRRSAPFGFRNKQAWGSQNSSRRWSELLHFACDTRLFLVNCFDGPSHSGRVMSDTELACSIQDDDAAVPIQALFQVVHGFLGRPFW
jgi:hypothetical protein